MKDFDQQVPQDNKVITAEQRQVKQEMFVASIRPHNGHKVFQFDLSNGEVTEAKFEDVSANYAIGDGKGLVRKKVIQQPNHLYCSALNKKNAIKKFVPMYDRLVQSGQIVRQVITPHSETI